MGNVLIPFDFQRAYHAMAPHCPLPPEEISRRLRESGLAPLLEKGLLSPSEFLDRVNAELETGMNYHEFAAVWTSIFLPETLVPEDAVRSLAGRYRLLVLSNTNAIHYEMVRETYSILRHFDHLVLSHEVKALKPEPAIYAAAIEAADAEPGECFFTDDIAAYVEGARQAGMQAEQFLGFEKLTADLEARGVRI